LKKEGAMSPIDPDKREIMRALDRIQDQLAERNKLSSPEHIAEMIGYASLKADLDEIKQSLAALAKRLG
jgi:hypothetical protein